MNWRWRIAQVAEIRWWRRYLRRKDPADYLDRKRVYWRRILTQAGVTPLAGQRVLDAGCGPAGIFLILPEQQVDAVDPLIPAYARHLPHFSPDAYSWVRFYSQPLESFVATQPYDLVFCLNAINHVADIDLALDHLLAALKPGGRLVLSVDAHRHAGFKHLFRLLPGDVLHPHQHGIDDYLYALERRACRLMHLERLKSGRIFDYYLIVAGKS